MKSTEEFGVWTVHLVPQDEPSAHTAVALYADLLDAEGHGDAAKHIRQQLAKVDAPAAPMVLNTARVDAALREVFAQADYDLHKSIEHDEDSGEDTYAEHVQRFVEKYQEQR